MSCVNVKALTACAACSWVLNTRAQTHKGTKAFSDPLPEFRNPKFRNFGFLNSGRGSLNALVPLCLCAFVLSTQLHAAQAVSALTFTHDIAPIISHNCVTCHN